MQLTAYFITREDKLRPCEIDRALAGHGEGSGSFWIHAQGFDMDELTSWLTSLDLSPFLRERLNHLGGITQVVPLSQALFLEMRILPPDSVSSPRQIAAVCLKNLLITFSREADNDASPSHERTLQDLESMDCSPSGVLCSLLLHQANRASRELHGIRTRVFQLDELMDRDPAQVSPVQILEEKDRLLKILAVAEEQLECFETLVESDGGTLDFSNLRGTTRLLLATAGSTERMAGRMEKRVSDLRQSYEAHQQEKLNHRLAVLTIVSAIFLPLSLVAGIWGMNFESMPELKQPMAYPVALGFMALMGTGLLLFFRRKGWLQ